MRARLKPYNVGAGLLLREDDLLIVTHLPPSRFIHVRKVIISNSGSLECAEWHNRQFVHDQRELEPEAFQAIRAAVSLTADCAARLEVFQHDFDSEAYEFPERRHLRFWHRGSRFECCHLCDSFFEDFKVSDQDRSTFRKQFSSLWSLLDDHCGFP